MLEPVEERLSKTLDELIDYLGETYCNLVGANSALGTVNRDVDACLAFLRRRERPAAAAEVCAPRPKREEASPAGAELPDEIEKILAKARRVVDPLQAKAASRAGGKKPAKAAEARGEPLAPTPKPAQKPRRKPELKLPPRVKELRKLATDSAEALLEDGHFVAGAASSFKGRALKLLKGGRPGTVGGGHASALEDLAERANEIKTRVDGVEDMTQSDLAMLRADMKDFLEQRQLLHKRIERMKEYGQQWKDVASRGSGREADGQGSGGVMKDITCSGKLNSLSMCWIPKETLARLLDGEEGSEDRTRNLLLQSNLALEGTSSYQRKHEVVAKARGLLQQKLLQLRVEGEFMGSFLGAVEELRRNQATRGMTMEDAVSLERLCALARFQQQLGMDPKSNQKKGFFFRQEKQEGG
ncbi:hypothetical protein A3770_04p32350 [Chloropicon primus]|uniref:Uncharacterized protein n=2 Tax=Chloropicon primus TaxID=1764295 RepID=A0A5B8MJW4_9CHLO|nr:hypothetical protein A3770_04p32350 [Chloropicon primus]|eukprot:QDZ20717.1 hypothetical protein A3770_04p32350 [Chloropicon primus]